MHSPLRLWLASCMLALACVLSATALPSCSTNPDPVVRNAVAYTQSRAVYRTTVQTLVGLIQANKLSETQVTRVEQLEASAFRLLTQWNVAIAAHQPFSAQASLESLLSELVQIQLETSSPEAP